MVSYKIRFWKLSILPRKCFYILPKSKIKSISASLSCFVKNLDFTFFEMMFCLIKINTIQLSTDLFVWVVDLFVVKQVMNFWNVKLVLGNTVPYCQKWCPIITPSEKINFGLFAGHILWFPIMIFIKRDININLYTMKFKVEKHVCLPFSKDNIG